MHRVVLFIFLSTPSARRATGVVVVGGIVDNISIHALREEGDAGERGNFQDAGDFYPRPPRGGRRSHSQQFQQCRVISIHALREEGDYVDSLSVDAKRISIHALREEGDPCSCRRRVPPAGISIHALREEGDSWAWASSPSRWDFYPRPPRGGQPLHGVLTFRESLFLSTPSARRATGLL